MGSKQTGKTGLAKKLVSGVGGQRTRTLKGDYNGGEGIHPKDVSL